MNPCHRARRPQAAPIQGVIGLLFGLAALTTLSGCGGKSEPTARTAAQSTETAPRGARIAEPPGGPWVWTCAVALKGPTRPRREGSGVARDRSRQIARKAALAAACKEAGGHGDCVGSSKGWRIAGQECRRDAPPPAKLDMSSLLPHFNAPLSAALTARWLHGLDPEAVDEAPPAPKKAPLKPKRHPRRRTRAASKRGARVAKLRRDQPQPAKTPGAAAIPNLDEGPPPPLTASPEHKPRPRPKATPAAKTTAREFECTIRVERLGGPQEATARGEGRSAKKACKRAKRAACGHLEDPGACPAKGWELRESRGRYRP